MRRLLLPSVVLALLAGCAHAPSTGTADGGDGGGAFPEGNAPETPAPEPLARIRTDVTVLLEAQGEATWSAWTTGAPLDVGPALKGREWLADGGALSALDALPKPSGAAETARRRALRDFLLGERLATLAAVGAAPAADLSFTFEGRTVSLRDAPSMLAAEPDAGRRAALDAARAPAAARAARAADTEATELAAAARKAGLGDLPSLARDLRGSSPESLAALAGTTLDATGSAYCSVMDALARGEVGAPLPATRLQDLPRILRASHEPKAHPASRLVADGKAAAAAAGADLATRIRLDDRPTPGKSQRPLAVPVRIPGDVRLSALPSGGASEARAFLHELGIALYLSGIRSSGVEARWLGSPGATETWGNLFESLAADPIWLNDRGGLTGHTLWREVKAAQADRLHAVRMQAARVLREVERSRGADPGPGGDAKVLSRALCRSVTAEEAARWPIARDPLLASADRLRGALLAAQIEAVLSERSAGPWWRWKELPGWLNRLWAPGGIGGADEVARAAGVSSISPEPLARTTRSRLDAAGR